MRVTPNRALLVRVVMFGLCILLIFGNFAGMAALKFHYDSQIRELTDLIASQQLSETAAENFYPTENLSNTSASLSVSEIARIAGASVAGI